MQRRFVQRLAVAVPGARVRWHYSVALDGVSVLVPRSQLARLQALPGATVWPTVTYHALGSATPTAAAAPALNRTPELIGATSLWGSDLATAGQGMKIAILDDGIDQTHPFFDPKGFSYPPGFPKGNTAYTTPKVIVARSFPSPSTSWKYASLPFDPVYSEHGTHVAGIAAGDYDTLASGPRGHVRVSGIAPRAYLGNYRVLTVPTKDYGPDGNAPEIAKAIDQAVADGMNVINLSLGEPEIEPGRDVVVRALENAAAAGVVSVVAAGNEGDSSGHGSIGSPATTPDAIAVAASSEGGDGSPADEIASFSSIGPTPISLLLKPDVTAPGEDVLSSIPHASWDSWDGTSMATPHVAGAAALLEERHPLWTVEQIKSALESTGDPVHVPGTETEVTTTHEGGGRIDLARADSPLVFTDPANLSWGLVRPGYVGTKTLVVSDAGGGLDPWSVSVAEQTAPPGVTITPDRGNRRPRHRDRGHARRLCRRRRRGGDRVPPPPTGQRRPPCALLVPRRDPTPRPRSAHDADPRRPLPRRHGGQAGARLVLPLSGSRGHGRRPDRPRGAGAGLPVHAHEARCELRRRCPHARQGRPGVSTARPRRRREPARRVTGLRRRSTRTSACRSRTRSSGRCSRSRGRTTSSSTRRPEHGRVSFLFRFWINDTTPPTVKLLHSSVRVGEPIRFSVRDSGAGVDPLSIAAYRNGTQVPLSYAHGIVSLETTTLSPGKHRITLDVSDYQETKNMEDIGPVLPNTRVFHATVVVRPSS